VGVEYEFLIYNFQFTITTMLHSLYVKKLDFEK